ncbi:hypothetical protein A2U01_0070428, partial [Trifolium medium]|nr:hypothetical protein [Trifolium medium]
SSCIETAFFCRFWSWRNARSRAAQRVGLVMLPVFLLVPARRAWVDGATRRFELLRAVGFLVPARCTGWYCATRRA